MNTDDFSYELPPEQIAQRPANPRDSSRLLVLDRTSGAVSHNIFHNLPEFLNTGDVLVFNDTRVLPARLKARKIPTGGQVEILLLKQISSDTWEALAGGKRVKPGMQLEITPTLQAEILEEHSRSRRIVRFSSDIVPLLEDIGEMPLPPYIHEPLQSNDEYQTMFARQNGSAAAPTAGLHFTQPLLEKIRTRGVKLAAVTLHVGLDTFAPVTEQDPQEHTIHTEWCSLSEDTAALLRATRANGGRIFAVGTTTTRVLETAAAHATNPDWITSFTGPTDLFILPGFQFKVVDSLITNFHLPRSTLLMLVSAFAGRERILNTYQLARQMDYRFYSFGDAMLIR
ncbi:MAG: tRNA preQ1(34) S-adenosylmethionine ribosyltransferase-isomerase QueA [Anaerolineales bacterium]|nr:tRNA preQ1(34) S-adenosylmethionine ribosyltransferase-isomerase QueA [Anaerolineales bacterium]